jgi:hypothetical protein
MDDELRAAIAELRADGDRNGFPMDHTIDAEVLEGAMHAMTMMPASTAGAVKANGLTSQRSWGSYSPNRRGR